jgi:hypothetical protein
MGLPNEEWRVCFANDGSAPDSSGRGKPRERNATDAFAPPQLAVCVRVRASCMLCACACARAVCAHACLSVRDGVRDGVCSACSVRLVRHVPTSAVRAERRQRRLHVWRREVSVEGARASAHVPFLRHARTRAHAREHTHASTRTRAHAREHTHASTRTRAHAKTQCVRASISACAHAWVTHACAQPIDHMHIRMLRRSDLMQL